MSYLKELFDDPQFLEIFDVLGYYSVNEACELPEYFLSKIRDLAKRGHQQFVWEDEESLQYKNRLFLHIFYEEFTEDVNKFADSLSFSELSDFLKIAYDFKPRILLNETGEFMDTYNPFLICITWDYIVKKVNQIDFAKLEAELLEDDSEANEN
jgi:hypothetical protein